jgi:hypothetical protein
VFVVVNLTKVDANQFVNQDGMPKLVIAEGDLVVTPAILVLG